MAYNPIPPRVWSRVQNPCSTNINFSSIVFDPLTNKNITQSEANFQAKMISKGNVLQYKNNSSRLTQKQKYSQISNGFWCNRQKCYATQSQTYSNPNTTGLQRINSIEIPFPNTIVGAPNNISGPFQYDVPNPYGCPSTSLQDGGGLICGTYQNPCTGIITQQGYEQKCYPSSCSDVPGKLDLCWDSKIQTWFPRKRYIMTNSGSKWPEGYKGFTSALRPIAPILSDSVNSNEVTLTWYEKSSDCIPTTRFDIYINNNIFQSVDSTITTITFTLSSGIYNFFVRAISRNIQSDNSNIVNVTI